MLNGLKKTILISDPRIGDAKNEVRDDFLDAFYIDFVQRLSRLSKKSPGRQTTKLKVDDELGVIYYLKFVFRIAKTWIGNLEPAGRRKKKNVCENEILIF